MSRMIAISLALVLAFSVWSADFRGVESETRPEANQATDVGAVTVLNRAGGTIQIFDSNGQATSLRTLPEATPGPQERMQMDQVPLLLGGTPPCSPSDTTSRSRTIEPGEVLLECGPIEGAGGLILREYHNGETILGALGAIRGALEGGDDSEMAPGPLTVVGGQVELLSNPITIDRMTTAVLFGYTQPHSPGSAVYSMGSADTYYLSDGSHWDSGAGSYYAYQISLDHVEVVGSTLRFVMVNPGPIYQQTDFDAGDHSAQGSLAAEGSLVIEATIGSTTGVLRGTARIASNDPTYYGSRFNFYSSPVGSVVPFELTYTLHSGTWEPDIFSKTFTYSVTGWVDFAHPVSTPALQGVSIVGSSQVPSESSVQFSAIAHFEGGISRDVTTAAVWTVQPESLASISQGLLSTQPIGTPEENLTLHVEYSSGGVTVQADKTVLLRQGGSADDPDAWEMYQGDARHTGFVPIDLQPDLFSLRWQRAIGSGAALNPVTAADGKVFVSLLTYFNDVTSLFALDARDGEILWSKGFGSVFSVNPPSFAYGNVYIQTGNHGSDTYLWAFDASTGDLVFQAPHSAQWERYFAPTIYEGTAYINGGYYGGMYAFDAFSGVQRWFLDLPQYDQWTPAVDASYAYAYVGAYSPAVYAANRLTGASAFTIPDPNFDWNGWSMNLAPVLGGHDDLVAIHDGRLISFNLPSRTIRYQLQRNFAGQPSIANDTVYAIDGGALVALNEMTGQQLWSWAPPQGSLQGALIVTNTHVFAATSSTTYAVELLSHSQAWSYPASGGLALGNETLYIASNKGVLTAIATPGHTPADLIGLEITGPSQVTENSSAKFTASARYSDGRVRDRSALIEWIVEPTIYAAFGDPGVLNVSELLDLSQDVVVRARYTERSMTVEASLNVRLVIGVPVQEFFRRNLAGAVAIENQLLDLLGAALARQLAVQRAAGTPSAPTSPPELILLANDVRHAIGQDRLASSALERSIEDLLRALSRLGSPTSGTTPDAEPMVPRVEERPLADGS